MILAGIDANAIRDYEERLPQLIQSVAREIEKREDLQYLIGPDERSLLIHHHWSHSEFMLTHVRTQDGSTLVQGMIQMYTTLFGRGFSPIYFPIEFETWKRAIAIHLDPNHPLLTLYQTLIDHHPEFFVLSCIPETMSSSEEEESLTSYFRSYLDAILEPNTQKAVEVSQAYIKTVWDIPEWWEHIITPALYEVGRLWAEGEITVGQEHVATSITQRVISLHYPKILEIPRQHGTIVVSSSPNEFHEIGARILADMLEIHGWDVYFTGANTPVDGILELLREHHAQFLCISTTMVSHLEDVAAMVREVRSMPDFSVHVIVGGQAYVGDPTSWKAVGADRFFQSASMLIHYLQTTATP
jgi:methanogenic corrinoid protein MtbC1